MVRQLMLRSNGISTGTTALATTFLTLIEKEKKPGATFSDVHRSFADGLYVLGMARCQPLHPFTIRNPQLEDRAQKLCPKATG